MRGNVEYRPYEPWHSEKMEFQPTAGFQIHERLQALAKDPSAYVFTIFRDEAPIMCLAGVQVWPRVMEVSACIDERCRHMAATISRSTAEILQRVVHSAKLHRVQMTVCAKEKYSQRWAEFLGFEREAVLSQYGMNREDYYLYRRLY